MESCSDGMSGVLGWRTLLLLKELLPDVSEESLGTAKDTNRRERVTSHTT